ncbi:CubicO group peptidase (beta-lactamase class C family) [Lutibacter sp. Hel_I_33_5]|uniref:serine hydrolase domain-containing protein n=1 Tax=Lutibacter sp. Hel_I_33_5 TaxID=1566289 RepID=UPI0011A12405|nr:serine hydrolase domain-containing protein [Lutibacter sp. Hel_I_33_5]TVZ56235.1 CubicO group peptidase (beta-lactamase class C family) [Lutibacter sp. Hel_I_33_5]
MKLKCTFFLLIFFSLVTAQAQLSEIQSQKINSLFNSWTEPNQPGGTLGIMQNGKIIYSKAFGLASLEYQVPNTTETIFNIASVSKQITAMGIVLLHQKGLLSIDDDIRKHLPDMPDFGHTITIRHMLHHTSGMRSLHSMLSLAGWRRGDYRTNDDLYRFMLKQKELNFIPGDEYLYCNTGYILMTNIIENVTKEKFPQWMKANIFEPLGMTNTYVEDRYDRIVPNNATSYYDSKDGFFRAVEFWGYVGSGNVHSTTRDLLNWSQNFSKPSSNWGSAFEMLKTTDKLNDGSENNYAFGVFIDEFNGYKTIQHGGSIGGFRSSLSSYPEEKLDIAILANFSSSKIGKIERDIVRILLKDKPKTIAKITKPNIPNNETIYALEQIIGRYEVKLGTIAKISIENDSLHVLQEWNKSEYNIYNTNGNVYKISEKSKVEFEFSELKNNKAQVLTVYNNGNKSEAKRYLDKDLSDINLNDYIGRFYSQELESTIDILPKKEQIIAHHARLGNYPLQLLAKDTLKNSNFGTIKIIRDIENMIIGIRISNGRAKNVWFEKQK